MLTKAYGESAMSKTRVTSGISVSKMAVETLQMTNAPDAPARQQLMKTWKGGRNGYERSPNHNQRSR